jgi:hypothetical protein
VVGRCAPERANVPRLTVGGRFDHCQRFGRAGAALSARCVVMLKRLRRANVKREAERDPGGKCGLLYRATELGGEVGECLK